MKKEDYLKNMKTANVIADYENQKGGREMSLKTKKRVSTLKQYYKIENKIKEGIKVIIFWAVLMIVAGSNYLN